ncbi:hypothetical protein ACVIQS_001915 [Bradyrhizobium diazoefficiens]
MILPSLPNTRESRSVSKPPSVLAGENVELDRDQRSVCGIEDAMRGGGADQLVADIAARIVDVHHLRVLDVGIGDLAVARLDLHLDVLEPEEVAAGKLVHRRNEIVDLVAHDEVDTMAFECFHRRRRALVGGAAQRHAPALAGEVRVLLRARQRELLLDDALGQDEPGIIIARRHDVFELAERVGAGEQRRRQTRAGGVEPHGRGPRQDADAVARPDR